MHSSIQEHDKSSNPPFLSKSSRPDRIDFRPDRRVEDGMGKEWNKKWNTRMGPEFPVLVQPSALEERQTQPVY